MKQNLLNKAFTLLSLDKGGREVITKDTFLKLMNSLPDSPRSDTLINILWFVLDSDGDGYLGNYIGCFFFLAI